MNNVVSEEQLDELKNVLLSYTKQYRISFDQQDYLGAYQAVQNILKILPNNPIALCDLGIVESRLEQYEESYKHLLQAFNASDEELNIKLLDALTETCFFLKKIREQKKYGKLAVLARKTQVENEEMVVLPKRKKAPTFNSLKPKENIISYSLFGSEVRYCEYAVLNAKKALEIFPDWRCRFYIDETVPRHVVNRLIELNAQVIFATDSMKLLPGVFWRFYVMDDPNVKRFIIRDADSLLSYREKMAVEDWIGSERLFHTMHDAKDHVELILPGMWGGCTGILPNIEQSIIKFIESDRFTTMNSVDQHFLRFCVWPTVKQSVLIHDSQGYEPKAAKFNTQASMLDHGLDDEFYVGRVEIKNYVQIKIQQNKAVDVITWSLTDEKDNEICSYDQVIAGETQFNILLPDAYVQKVLDGTWEITTLVKKYL